MLAIHHQSDTCRNRGHRRLQITAINEPPLVSVIALNYNSLKFIASCIESVQAQSYPAIEIIVIDNASTDDSVELAQSAIRGRSNARLIQNEHNLGFAGGMNVGAGCANGELVMFLNADVVLGIDYVAQAVAALQNTDQKVGMIGGRISRWVDGQLTEELDAGPVMMRKRFSHTSSGSIDTQAFVFAPAGSCPLVRKEMLEDTKLASGDYYDSDYFMYSEDTDLWFRAHLRGWKCLYVPKAVAWHVRAGSYAGKRRVHERPLPPQRWAMRNRWITMLKVLPVPLMLRLSPYLLLAELLTVGFFIVRSPRSLVAWGQAIGDFISNLPATVKKRRHIQSQRTAEVKDLVKLFAGFWSL